MLECMRYLVVVLFVVFVGCSKKVPPIAYPEPAREALVVYESYRVSALSFTRAAGAPAELSTAIPAMLLAELQATGRFGVYEGGGIRVGAEAVSEAAIQEKTASDHVDAYLSGAITTWESGRVCVNVWMSNAFNHEVVYMSNMCLPAVFSGDKQSVEPSSIKALAEDIARSVRRIEYGAVTAAEGSLLIIDKGADAGVRRGMVAYLRDTGRSTNEVGLHQSVAQYSGVSAPSSVAVGAADRAIGLPKIVGELVILSADARSSTGVLVRGEYARPNDIVFFK